MAGGVEGLKGIQFNTNRSHSRNHIASNDYTALSIGMISVDMSQLSFIPCYISPTTNGTLIAFL